jgi:hypothetical protein
MYDLGHRSNCYDGFFLLKTAITCKVMLNMPLASYYTFGSKSVTVCWSIFEAKTTNLNKATDEVPKLLGNLDIRVFKCKK